MSLVKALLLDVGGVMMTNGWDTALRKELSEVFNVEHDEMESRHRLIFDTYETGKLSFDEYLTRVIFFKERSYTLKEVKDYTYNAVRPFEDVMNYIRVIKEKYNLKVGVVSNEGRELAVDRIQRFDLPSFIDFFYCFILCSLPQA